ncbi:MAG: hypothetical protein J7493_15275 [Porphyrobacter sp.]|nr:hypothetical protein [Porphyrobacter sp.]
MPSILAAIVLSGCVASSAAARTDKTASPAAAESQARVPLKKGMPYAEARRKLLAAGWRPLEDLTCYDNVYGGAEAPAGENICETMPELSMASGDGHLVMQMMDPSERVLRIFAYGDVLGWNVPGQATELSVTDWEVY